MYMNFIRQILIQKFFCIITINGRRIQVLFLLKIAVLICLIVVFPIFFFFLILVYGFSILKQTFCADLYVFNDSGFCKRLFIVKITLPVFRYRHLDIRFNIYNTYSGRMYFLSQITFLLCPLYVYQGAVLFQSCSL